MNRNNFPLIALGLSVPLLALLLYGAQPVADGSNRLPMLTLLAISEFGAIVNAVATWLGVAPLLQGQFHARRAAIAAASLLLAGVFSWHLILLWPL